jgi:hypothetical protein
VNRQEREAVVDWFAERMKAKLREPRNEAKGGWRDDGYLELMSRLSEECRELETEICDPMGSIQMLVDEAADVANFAMMIADRARSAGGKGDEV